MHPQDPPAFPKRTFTAARKWEVQTDISSKHDPNRTPKIGSCLFLKHHSVSSAGAQSSSPQHKTTLEHAISTNIELLHFASFFSSYHCTDTLVTLTETREHQPSSCPCGVPVCAAVQFCQALAPSFGVKGVHVLGHQPVELSQFLPVSQHQVRRVGLVGGELGPAHEVPCPVPLPGAGATNKLCVLDGPPVGPGVEPDSFRAVIWDPRFSRDSSPGHYKELLGVRNKTLQLLYFHRIRGKTGWHESQVWGGPGHGVVSEVMESGGSATPWQPPGREHAELKAKNRTQGR